MQIFFLHSQDFTPRKDSLLCQGNKLVTLFMWRDSNLWNGYVPTNCFEYKGMILSPVSYFEAIKNAAWGIWSPVKLSSSLLERYPEILMIINWKVYICRDKNDNFLWPELARLKLMWITWASDAPFILVLFLAVWSVHFKTLGFHIRVW